jgi:type VI secretion system secreted protein VgrG
MRMSCEDELSADAIEVERLEIREQLSAPYRAVVRFRAAEDTDLEEIAADLIGTMAHVTYDGAHLHGIIADITSESREPDRPAWYRARIVPRFAMLGMTHQSRVFHDRGVLELVRLILDENGLTEKDGDLEVTVSDRYDLKREIIVQYEETDLAFVSRLLEDEGIAYHFVQHEDQERMVLTDTNANFPERHDTLPYAGHGYRVGDEAIFTVECERQLVASEVILKDYDWRRPALALMERAGIDDNGIGLQVSTREHYLDANRGKRLAAIRAEQKKLARERFHVTTNATGLSPGTRFKIGDHPVHSWDRTFLVLEASRTITNDRPDSGQLTERNDLIAVDAEVRFRPALATPKPRMPGVHYATVDGVNNGVVAPIDDRGRYRVILTFAGSESENQRAKLWVRRAQPLGGAPAGMHFPLLVGTEVLLAFVDSDPDRPLILGAIPNALTASPVTQANATQYIVRSAGGVRVLMDDAVAKVED